MRLHDEIMGVNKRYFEYSVQRIEDTEEVVYPLYSLQV